jgi:hypothetical protein
MYIFGMINIYILGSLGYIKTSSRHQTATTMSSSQQKSSQHELLCEEYHKAERWPEWLGNYVIINQGLSDILRKIDEQREKKRVDTTGGGDDDHGGRALIEKALADIHEKFEPMETARNAKMEELTKAKRAAFQIECAERRASQQAFMKELENESKKKRKAAADPKTNKKMKA